jgi:transcriptional antiterminator RfaH
MTWHLVYTKPRKENLALEKLSEQGLIGYLPLKPVERIRRTKRQVVQEPLFHRYLFIEADDRFLMRRHAIRSTPGVSHLLQIGETDASVDDELIGIIRSLEAGHQDQVEAYFKPNSVVKITQGIYHDLEAIFVEDQGEQRALLLIQLLQTDTRISIDKHHLSKI